MLKTHKIKKRNEKLARIILKLITTTVLITFVLITLIQTANAQTLNILGKKNKEPISATIEKTTVDSISSQFLGIMVNDGYSVDKQTSNVVEFSKVNSGTISALSRIYALQQSEKINCSIANIQTTVTVSCRSFNVAVNKDGQVKTDDQTHRKKIRKRLFEKLALLKG